MAEICIVVAASKNNVIGRDNGLPWRLKGDMQFFKRVTMGHPLVMGRKTFDSIGKPLPGRKTIVVTTQTDWAHEGVLVAHSLADALSMAEQQSSEMGVSKIMLVGGAQLYRQALPQCDRLYLTQVDAVIDGDAFFPELDYSEWEEESSERVDADSSNEYAFSMLQLKRKA